MYGPHDPKTPRDLRKHAIRRAKERYNISFSNEDIRVFSKLIQKQDQSVKFICKQSNRISHWQINYNEQILYVVYDKTRHTIVTFLPKDVTQNYYSKKTKEPTMEKVAPKIRDLTMNGFLPESWLNT